MVSDDKFTGFSSIMGTVSDPRPVTLHAVRKNHAKSANLLETVQTHHAQGQQWGGKP